MSLPMTLLEYQRYDALGLRQLILKGEVTAKELLEMALAVYALVNPKTNAVVRLMLEAAFEQISTLDKAAPLYGVPFLLKDLSLLYQGEITSQGSVLTQQYRALYDSELVKRYKKAGLIIFGKTNTPEFGLNWATESELLGPCRNPYDLTRTPGGSSGGAAAAVASGVVPMAHASDGGGSIRVPAACCGLIGLKPTRARTPCGPDAGEGWAGLSISHVITRSVRDSAFMLDLTHGPEVGAPYAAPYFGGSFLKALDTALPSQKIAVWRTSPLGNPVDEACLEAVESAIKACLALGHEVEEAAPNFDFEALQKAIYVVMTSQIRQLLNTIVQKRQKPIQPEELEKATFALAELALHYRAEDYVAAIQTIQTTARQISLFFEKYSICITPALAKPPPFIGELIYQTGDVIDFYRQRGLTFAPFSSVWNATGQPAIVLPFSKTKAGLPMSVQFVGRFGEEASLLQLAKALVPGVVEIATLS